MTAQNYGMVLTAAGAAKFAGSIGPNGVPVDLAGLAYGDGAGQPRQPTGTETALAREVARVPLEAVAADPENPAYKRVTAVLPKDIGGFTIREVGLYDTDGDLLAYGNFPDTYKPLAVEGVAFEMPMLVVIAVGANTTVTIKLDVGETYATREWVLTHADFFAVRSATTAVAPGAPAVGDKYLVPAAGSAPGAADAFAGQGGLIGLYRGQADGGWLFFSPAPGAEARAADTGQAYQRTPTGWRTSTATVAEALAGQSSTLFVTPDGLRAALTAAFGEDRAAFFGSI